ncbi:YIP1 family protein [Archaeoglobus sp.]
MLLLATLVALDQYVLTTKLSNAIPEKLGAFFKIGGYIGVVSSSIGIFAVWVIIAVIMHGLSAFFEGEGDFKRTFEFVGYSFFSSLVGSLVTVPMPLYYTRIPEISLASYSKIQTYWGAVIVSIIPRNLIYSNLVVSFAVTLWSLTIWSFALRHARRVELREAFVCALIPTVLFAVYQVWSILKLL